jgi:predicted phage terminase large subunit-like protein
MDCAMGVPILPKLPEFPGVRDGYRLAFDLRSKAFTCHSRVRAARRRCESFLLPQEQAGLEPSVPLESVRSIWRSEPNRARSGLLKASGTQLIQELIADGCHGVTRYEPTCDKIMRLHAQTALIENGFVYIPETAPWLDEYLHELTVFPKGKHDDQVDSTAQFLDWFKRPFPGQGILEYYRMRAERRQNPENPERYRVRLLAPLGLGSVQTFSGRHINVGPDGTIEMSADDAQYLIRDGWTKLAEWTRDEAA